MPSYTEESNQRPTDRTSLDHMLWSIQEKQHHMVLDWIKKSSIMYWGNPWRIIVSKDLADMAQTLLIAKDLHGGTLKTSHPTALHEAVKHNAFHCVDVLLKQGWDVNAVDHWGRTPLCLTVSEEEKDTKVRMVKKLIKAGADVNLATDPASTNELPLHRALKKRCTPTWALYIQMLMNESTPWMHQNHLGETPLHVACRYCSTWEVFKKMAELGAGDSLDVLDHRGCTPRKLFSERFRPTSRTGRAFYEAVVKREQVLLKKWAEESSETCPPTSSVEIEAKPHAQRTRL